MDALPIEPGPTLDHDGDRRQRGRRGRRWDRQTFLFGLSISLFIHMTVLLGAAWIYLERPPAAAGDGAAEVPLAILSEAELTELSQVALAEQAPTTSAQLDDSPITEQDFGTPVPDAALSSVDIPDDQLGGAGNAPLEGANFGSGADGVARFFGVEARGTRFAYIVDVSGSMQGDRLSALKTALVGSIAALLEHTHFTIVLYSADADPLTGDRWLGATEKYKRDASRRIQGIRAYGGTNPLPAFQHVFQRMKPRPDAIYFMTDGQFQTGQIDKVLSTISRLNNRGSRRTPIHCITFIERGSEDVMRQIARTSGGTYTHVEGPDRGEGGGG